MWKKISSVAAFVLLLAGFALACNLCRYPQRWRRRPPRRPQRRRLTRPARLPPLPPTPAWAPSRNILPFPLIFPMLSPGDIRCRLIFLRLRERILLRSHPRRKQPSRITDFSLLLRSRVNSASSYQMYESLRYSDLNQPVFTTTDSVYHIYHLIFDKMLRDLERDNFIANLKAMTSAMLAASHAQYQQAQGSALEDQARRNVAYFAVAAQLLGLPDAVPCRSGRPDQRRGGVDHGARRAGRLADLGPAGPSE